MSITDKQFNSVMQYIMVENTKPNHNIYFRGYLVVVIRDDAFIVHYTDPFDNDLYRVLISLRGKHIKPIFNIPDSLEEFKKCFSVSKPVF